MRREELPSFNIGVYEWVVLLIAPTVSALIKNLHENAKSSEKILNGIGTILSGIAIGGYLRIELKAGLWLTSLVVFCISNIFFSLVIVAADNSKKVAKILFDEITNRFVTFVKEFTIKK